MQPSKKIKLILIRIVKVILFLTICGAINLTICQYLSPSAHKSNEMWNYYYSQKDADTLIVGTSVTDMISEYVIDEYTGRCCINMGTPSQYFATSKELIETGCKERPIDTVVLMMGFDALERDEDLTASLSVEKAYLDSRNAVGKVLGFGKSSLEYSLERRNITTADSINRWMFWPVNCISYFDEIKSNLEKKQYYKDVVNESASMAWQSQQYDRIPMPGIKKLTRETQVQLQDIKAIAVSEESVMLLKQMAEYCNNNGIQFIVTISPHKPGYVQSFGDDYERLNALVRNTVEGMGCAYINMNDLPNVQNIMTDEYFVDSEHVTREGIEVASGVMSDILNLLTGKRK